MLTLDNIHTSDTGAAAIYVHGATGVAPIVLVDNLIVEGWGWDNLGWGAISCDANTDVTLGFNHRFRGHGTVHVQGPVTVDQ